MLLLDVDGVLVIPPDWFGVKLLREHPQEARAFFEGAFLPATRGETDLLSHVPAFLTATGRPGTPGGNGCGCRCWTGPTASASWN